MREEERAGWEGGEQNNGLRRFVLVKNLHTYVTLLRLIACRCAGAMGRDIEETRHFLASVCIRNYPPNIAKQAAVGAATAAALDQKTNPRSR